MQSQVAGLEREIQLAQRQIDLERSKQEELVRERERWAGRACAGGVWVVGGWVGGWVWGGMGGETRWDCWAGGRSLRGKQMAAGCVRSTGEGQALRGLPAWRWDDACDAG